MVRTPLCDLLSIGFPIIQAGMATMTSAELVAAVSNAGGLGSLGAALRTASDFRAQLTRTCALTRRPFAVNFVLAGAGVNEESLALTLEVKPRLISFAQGDPGDYVQRVHQAGILVMHQAMNVQQARKAAERGAYVVIAQGAEAGGFGGSVENLTLIPQVVDAVSPIPTIAAGGIADGRGLAAALVLGAQGVNIGTRFLASLEAPIPETWKEAILAAESQEAIKAEFWPDIFPPTGAQYLVSPRVLHSPFVDEWLHRREEVGQEAERLQAQVGATIGEGKFGELLPFTGQTAGLIHDILPAAEIVRRIMDETEEALTRTTRLLAKWLCSTGSDGRATREQTPKIPAEIPKARWVVDLSMCLSS